MCAFCPAEPETVMHMMCGCKYVRDVCGKMKDWLNKISEGKVQFTNENIIFGFKGINNNPLNRITLISKQTVY